MHELHLAQDLLESAIEQATYHGGKRIAALHVCLGEASHVTPESLGFCLEAASRGTMAEGARLETRPVTGTAKCQKCGLVFEMRSNRSCPQCGSDAVEMRRGGVYLESLEME